MKRSRIAGSASLADVLMLAGKSEASSPPHLWEPKRARAMTSTCRETVSTPTTHIVTVESLSSRLGFMKLLEECRWCRKWIPPISDVFMYGGCAYCTENCRAWQYEKDAKEGRISPVRNAELQKMNLAKKDNNNVRFRDLI